MLPWKKVALEITAIPTLAPDSQFYTHEPGASLEQIRGIVHEYAALVNYWWREWILIPTEERRKKKEERNGHRLFDIGRRYVRWPLGGALVSLIVYHAFGVMDPARDFFEGGQLMIAERGGWARAEWLVGPVYTLTPYPPGYHFAVALLGGSDSGESLLTTGRALSMGAGLLTAATIALVVVQRTATLEAGLLAAAVFLHYSGISFWLQLFRVDALATFLAIAAYAVPTSSAGLWASASLAVAASLVKQPAILVAVPVATHFLLSESIPRSGAVRQRRPACVGGRLVCPVRGVGRLLLRHGLGGKSSAVTLPGRRFEPRLTSFGISGRLGQSLLWRLPGGPTGHCFDAVDSPSRLSSRGWLPASRAGSKAVRPIFFSSPPRLQRS